MRFNSNLLKLSRNLTREVFCLGDSVPSKTSQLGLHHSRIAAWREEGLDLRQIADRLCVEGLSVDHNAVYRYCKKSGIPTQKIEPAEILPPAPELVEEEIPVEAATPVEEIPAVVEIEAPPTLERPAWQAPAKLYTLLDSGPWWVPDLPLVQFGSEDESASWTLQDACEGVFITGATGSGKSSGSGAMLARSFLEYGFGGLVLTVKPDERKLWEHYAKQCGRSEQLCIVEPGGKFRLNFLDYEASCPHAGSGHIENLVNLFYTLLEANSRHQGEKTSQAFWENAGRQLLRNILRVLDLSLNSLSLQDIGKFLSEAPKDIKQVESGQWKTTKHFGKWLHWATFRATGTAYERVIAEARRYWLEEFPTLAKETRSCLITGLSAMIDSFIEPAIHDLFCTDTTLLPEAVTEGAIILVDLPLKYFKSVGLFAQMIWKQLFQEAIERRSDADNSTRRPVFLWVDESQFFFSAYDGLFQSTARSSRCATVYLTQNIANYYGAINKAKVDGFLGNLNTKIFHNNNDPTTNHWAAEQIGKCLTSRFSTSSSTSQKGWFDFSPTTSTTASMQETLEYEIQPGEFTQLRTGSRKNGGLVDAYFVKSGTTFAATNKHYFKATFQQETQN